MGKHRKSPSGLNIVACSLHFMFYHINDIQDKLQWLSEIFADDSTTCREIKFLTDLDTLQEVSNTLGVGSNA
jgi:hypothetical protein